MLRKLLTGLAVALAFSACEVHGELLRVYWSEYVGPNYKLSKKDFVATQDISTSIYVGDVEVDLAGGKVYWGESGKIRRANLDGCCIQDVVTGLTGDVNKIELEPTAGRVYWIRNEFIRRANLDGTGIEDVIQRTGYGVWDFVIDESRGKLYWLESNASEAALRQVNLEIPPGDTPDNRSDVETLYSASSSNQLHRLGLDEERGVVYFTYWTGSSLLLYKYDINLSDTQSMGQIPTPQDIEIDSVGGMIYLAWGDSGAVFRGKLSRMPIAGGPLQLVMETANPMGGTGLLLAPVSLVAGDMNGDGLVNALDVQPFVDKLLNCP